MGNKAPTLVTLNGRSFSITGNGIELQLLINFRIQRHDM